jgi:hypothetical protein
MMARGSWKAAATAATVLLFSWTYLVLLIAGLVTITSPRTPISRSTVAYYEVSALCPAPPQQEANHLLAALPIWCQTTAKS